MEIYNYEKACETLQQLSLEEANWGKYYFDYGRELPRCQIEAIKKRVLQIKDEKELLLGIISRAV